MNPLLEPGKMSVMRGPGGCGKSFVAADMAICAAAGLPFLNWALPTSGAIYCPTEGPPPYPRFDVALRDKGLTWPPLNLAVCDLERSRGVFSGYLPIEAQDIAAAILEVPSDWRPGLVIIDAVQNLVQENSHAAMHSIIDLVDHVRVGSGAHVMLVCHSVMQMPRGTALLENAADTVLQVSRGQIDVIKQAQWASGDYRRFMLQPMPTGHNSRSCVVRAA